MAIRYTQVRTRPSADIDWWDPNLSTAWAETYNNADTSFITENTLELETSSTSEDGLNMTTTGLYKDLESFIYTQKDVIPFELRKAQRQYRDGNNIRATITWVDTDTGSEITREQIIDKEREMRAAGLLSDDHDYVEVRVRS